MNRGVVLRLSLALGAEIIFFAALNFFDDWTLESMPAKFVEAAFLSGLAYLIAVSKFGLNISLPKQAFLFWGVAIVLRLAALPLVPADDIWRYEWDGKIQQAGFNPYLIAPVDARLDDIRRDFPQAAKINHPELRSFDPPGVELIFNLFSRVTDRPLFYKICFALADLAAVFLLLRLFGGDERYRNAAWYAWNPLLAYTFAGAAHVDSLMILPLVGGILSLVRSTSEADPPRKWFWAVVSAVLLGVAISINLVAALLLPLWAFALRGRAIVLAIAAVVPVLFSIPFGFPKVPIWDSLGQFVSFNRLNDLFWWVIEESFWPNPHQRSYHYYLVLIVCVLAVSFFFVRDWKRGMLWCLGTALVLSPVLQPWYCTWILPLATWRRAYAWHVLSITLFAYYLFWDERLFGLPWHAEPWMRGLIIAPVLAALIMLGARKKAPAPAN